MSSTLGSRGDMWTRRAWSYLRGRTPRSAEAPLMRPSQPTMARTWVRTGTEGNQTVTQ
jgi:hypothetical protein